MGGAVLYNKPVYEQARPAGAEDLGRVHGQQREDQGGRDVAPVIQTYRETWTSQLFVLGDFHNVSAAEPDFADKYTKNQAKYATSPAALKGFEHLQEVHDAGYHEQGLRLRQAARTACRCSPPARARTTRS